MAYQPATAHCTGDERQAQLVHQCRAGLDPRRNIWARFVLRFTWPDRKTHTKLPLVPLCRRVRERRCTRNIIVSADDRSRKVALAAGSAYVTTHTPIC